LNYEQLTAIQQSCNTFPLARVEIGVSSIEGNAKIV